MKKPTEARLKDAIAEHLTKQDGYVLVDYREGVAKDRYDKIRMCSGRRQRGLWRGRSPFPP